MREIKFRVWHDDKMRLDVSCIRGAAYVYNDVTLQVLPLINPVAILMEYTGLKDKNGKEIYEGDILVCKIYGKEYTAQVEWSRCGWWYFFTDFVTCDKCEHKEPTTCRSPLYDIVLQPKHKIVEVIGNIKENPELLK